MGFNQKINDAMNNASRQVTTEMMKDAPADLKYVYIGPVDEKTRPFCLDAASQGALTEAQILGLGGEYAESLVSGGGINCRHNWELASDDIQKQFHRGNEAQKIIDEKLTKLKSKKDILYSKVLTAEESIKNNKKESFFAYNKNGDVIFQKKGTESHVGFSNFDLLDMKANGVEVLTHNHPIIFNVKNATFSYQDISLAMKYDIPEIRAVGKDKVYIFRQSKGAVKGGLKWKEIKKEIVKIFDEGEGFWYTDNDINSLYNNKKINDYQAINMYTDKLLKENAKKYGWIYETEPI
tara:strand:- start:756 stop:1637 length:882 start_codon:yes stop_codon:yes gene_type:complete